MCVLLMSVRMYVCMYVMYLLYSILRMYAMCKIIMRVRINAHVACAIYTRCFGLCSTRPSKPVVTGETRSNITGSSMCIGYLCACLRSVPLCDLPYLHMYACMYYVLDCSMSGMYVCTYVRYVHVRNMQRMCDDVR
jgi:hypothetical protein